MTVWQLVWALTRLALRGRGRHSAYVVVAGDLPDAVQEEIDNHDLRIVRTSAPALPHAAFVLVIAEAERSEETSGIPSTAW
jgi:hypothetical protein